MKGLQKLIRQLESLQKGWLAAHRWPELEEEAHLMAAYLHTYDKKKHTLTLDHPPRTLSVDPRKTARQKMAELYAAVKKHKLSLPRLEKAIYQKKEEIALFEERPALTPVPQVAVKKEPYHTLYSKSGLKMLVGKNAASNELITFRLARGNDLWLHAAHEKGAHIIVCLPKGHPCDEETLQEALKLALKHSKAAKRGEAEVVVALKKFVKKPSRGSQGQAQVAHPKFYKVTTRPLL